MGGLGFFTLLVALVQFGCEVFGFKGDIMMNWFVGAVLTTMKAGLLRDIKGTIKGTLMSRGHN